MSITRVSGSITTVGAAHASGVTGIVGGFRMLADETVWRVIGLHMAARLTLKTHDGFESILRKDFADEPDTGEEIFPVWRIE